MVKNNVIFFSSNNFNLTEKKILVPFLSIMTGLILGTIIYSFVDENIVSELSKLIANFNEAFINKEKTEVFSDIALSGLLYPVIMFIVGGSIFGSAVCPLITVMQSMGLGFATTFFYCFLGLKGVEYILLIFFPGKIFLFFSMILMTRICIEMSGGLINCDKSAVYDKIKIFSLKSAVVLFLCLISRIIDFLCMLMFSGLFDFSDLL